MGVRPRLSCMRGLSAVLIFWDPMKGNPSGSSVHGILGIVEWVAVSSSRGSSWPRGRIWVLRTSCIGRRILHSEPHGKSLQTRFQDGKAAVLPLLDAHQGRHSLYLTDESQVHPASSGSTQQLSLTTCSKRSCQGWIRTCIWDFGILCGTLRRVQWFSRQQTGAHMHSMHKPKGKQLLYAPRVRACEQFLETTTTKKQFYVKQYFFLLKPPIYYAFK